MLETKTRLQTPRVYSVRSGAVKQAALLAVLLLSSTTNAPAAEVLDAARRTEEQVAQVTAELAAGEFEEVLSTLSDLPTDTGDPRLWNARGVALAGLGRDRDAVSAYETGIRIDPSLAEAHLNLAISLERLGVTGRAMAEFEQAAELAPDSYEARLGLGRALLRYSRLKQARQQLELARTLDQDDPRAWEALAELADAQGDARAMREAWEAVESRGPSPRSARRLGELASATDPGRAQSWLETCLDRDPSDAECAGAAGALALQAGDLKAAHRLLTASLELDADQPQVLHNLLLSYQIEGEIASLEQVVERWPPVQASSWGIVTLARRAAGDLRGALQAARRAVEAEPEDLDLVNLLAVVLDENGRTDEAIRRWEWILQRDGSYQKAAENLARRKR
jgi:Flp pilus assembly protein TadD